MDRRPIDFALVFGADGALEGTEGDAVIELAFLMANANGDASPDELEALRALIKHVDPRANVGATIEKLDDALGSAESIGDRVRAAAANLSRPRARELAYKAVYAIAVYDLETNMEERELEEMVIDALKLDDKRAHELGLETTHALLAKS